MQERGSKFSAAHPNPTGFHGSHSRPTAQPHPATDWLAAIAEPTRLTITRLLATGDKTVTVLATACGTEIVNVSLHLKVMKAAGLVRFQKDGRFVIYTLLGAKAVAGGIELSHPAGLKLFIALG